jgi:diguanylate cyclase (GGDEF)-like protein
MGRPWLDVFKVDQYMGASHVTYPSRDSIVLFFFFALLLSAFSSFASDKNLSFKRVLPEHVEELGYINVITQDDIGFLWFGGSNGLGRYDGHDLHIYRHDQQDETSLIRNFITDMIVDSQNNLWVATREGLNKYDPLKNNFIRYAFSGQEAAGINHVNSIVEADESTFWLGTQNGLYSFNKTTGAFKAFPFPDGTILDDSYAIADIAKAKDGSIWLGLHSSGVAYFDISKNSFVFYQHDENNDQSLSSNAIRHVYFDRQNRLWFSTYGNGLNQFIPQNGTFIRYINGESSDQRNIVWRVLEDTEGYLWVGNGAAVSLLDVDKRQFQNFSHLAEDPLTPGHHVVTEIFQDMSGEVWLGFYPSGVDIYDVQASAFTSYRYRPYVDSTKTLCDGGVESTFEDKNKNLWIGVGFGLSYFNRERNTINCLQHKKGDLTTPSGNTVLSVIEDNEQTLWLGIWSGGLNRFNEETGQFVYYMPEEGNEKSIIGREPWDVIEDSRGDIWVATEAGVARYNHQTDDFTRFYANPDSNGNVPNIYARVLYEDSDENFWVGTAGGLHLLDRDTGEYTVFRHDSNDPSSISDNFILSIHEDSQKRFWVGTDNSGFNLMNRSTGRFKSYTTNDGLPNDTVTGIQEDKLGYLWLGTQKGLSRFDPKTETFKNYITKHGLTGNLFNRNTPTLASNGDLVFGHSKGLVVIAPTELTINDYIPPVVITDFKVLNETIMPGDDSPMSVAIELEKEIHLDHTQSIFSFGFSALSYRAFEDNRYQYRLRGFDSTWLEADKQRSATYTNLDAGRYVFEVRASNNDGLWNETPARVAVIIHPAPWRTWWAYSIYAVVVFLLVFLYLYNQRIKVRNLDRVVAQRTQELEDETKLLKETQSILEAANNRIEEASLTDPLTSLRNRRFLTKHIDSDVAWVERQYKNSDEDKRGDDRHGLIFMLMDIDKFKSVNDKYGHSAGDNLLRDFSAAINSCVRESDYIMRWGGEEFLIVARASSTEEGEQLAERIRAHIEEYAFEVKPEKILNKTCSIGYAVFPLVPDSLKLASWEQVIDIADRALFVAKKSGRNCWVGIHGVNDKFNGDLQNVLTLKDKDFLSYFLVAYSKKQLTPT